MFGRSGKIRQEYYAIKQVPLKMKEKFYRTVARPATIHGYLSTERWIRKENKDKIRRNENAKVDVTRSDGIGNEYIRENIEVTNIVGKMGRDERGIMTIRSRK